MNSKVIIGVAVVLFLLGGAGALVMFKNKANPTAPESIANDQSVVQETSPTAIPAKKSLKDLLALSGAQKCTFTSTETPGVSDGVVYVSGGKVRGDFTTTVENQTSRTHVITDSNNVYFWTDGQTSGIKMGIDIQATPGAPGGAIDWNTQADYNCTQGAVDASLFEVPSTIKFTEFKIPSTSSQCEQCNILSGDLKTKCLETLKCQ